MDGKNYVDCNAKFSIGFEDAKDRKITVDSENAVSKQEGKCQLLIISTPKPKGTEIDIVMGMPLNLQYCLQYFLVSKKIGFTEPKEQTFPTDPTPVTQTPGPQRTTPKLVNKSTVNVILSIVIYLIYKIL